MRKLPKVFLGAALGLAVHGFLPAPAAAQYEFCDTTENYTCCCNVSTGGAVTSCNCSARPPVRET